MQAYELYSPCGIPAFKTTPEVFYALVHYLQSIHITHNPSQFRVCNIFWSTAWHDYVAVSQDTGFPHLPKYQIQLPFKDFSGTITSNSTIQYGIIETGIKIHYCYHTENFFVMKTIRLLARDYN